MKKTFISPKPQSEQLPMTASVTKPDEGDSTVAVALKEWANELCADPLLAVTAARLAEIGATRLLWRALEVLDCPEEYAGWGAEALASEVFGCIGDELHGQDVEDRAVAILEPYLAAKKAKENR